MYGTTYEERAQLAEAKVERLQNENAKLLELLRCCRTWIDPKETGDTDSETLCWQVDAALTPNVEFSGSTPLHGASSAGTQGYASANNEERTKT